MVRRTLAPILVMALLGLALIPIADAGTTQIHVKTEEGGPVLDGANGDVINMHGTLFWNGDAWVSSETAAHMYFVHSSDNSTRIVNHTTDVTLKGGDTGTVWSGDIIIAGDPVGCTINGSLYQYQMTIDGSSRTVEAHQYEISTPDWKVILRSRCDGNSNGSSYFHAYISQSTGNTLVLREGVNVTSTSLDIQQALQASLGQDHDFTLTGTGNNAYWLDSLGGSDMAGVTYQVTTDQYDLGSIDQVVVSEFAVSYVADDGAVHHLVFQPETRLASDVGAIDDGTVPSGLFDPMMAIGLIVIILMAVLIFMMFRRQKKKE